MVNGASNSALPPSGQAKFPPVPPPRPHHFPALREHCLSFPGAYEDYPWGETVYKVGGKLFATWGPEAGDLVIGLKATPEDADVLTAMPGIVRGKYVGRYGWINVTVADASMLELARDLVARSHELVVSKQRGRRLAPQAKGAQRAHQGR